jgi:hypothetical protein
MENSTNDGMLVAFPSDNDDEIPNQTTATVTASMASRAGRAFARVARNYQPNPSSLFSFMSRQTTLSDVAAQRTLTECADTTDEDDTPMAERALLDRGEYLHACAADGRSNEIRA